MAEVLKWSPQGPTECDQCGLNEDGIAGLKEVELRCDKCNAIVREKNTVVFEGPRMSTNQMVGPGMFLKYSCVRCGNSVYMETKQGEAERMSAATVEKSPEGAIVPNDSVIDTKVKGETKEIDHRMG